MMSASMKHMEKHANNTNNSNRRPHTTWDRKQHRAAVPGNGKYNNTANMEQVNWSKCDQRSAHERIQHL